MISQVPFELLSMSTEVYVTRRKTGPTSAQLVAREGDEECKQSITGVTALTGTNRRRGPLMSVGHRDDFKFENQATQPYFNNQNTLVMVARSCEGYLMVMHETRIFYFEFVGHNDPESGSNNSGVGQASVAIDTVWADDHAYIKAAGHVTDLLLGMLTVRKYRLLTSFYLLWNVLDKMTLFALFGLLFYSGKSRPFMSIIGDHVWVFAVLGMEIFYDVLEFTVKIWILNRVSVYIVAIICALYAVAFWWYGLWSNVLVVIFFSLRLMAIVLEIVIDFCIDKEIEYDLWERSIHSINIPYCFKSDKEERMAFPYCGGSHNEIQLADGWQFRGTKCAWTADNVFKTKLGYQYENGMSLRYRCPFNICFAVTYGLVGLPLIVAMVVVVAVLTCLKRCCCGCRRGGNGSRDNTICNELLNRYSY